MNIIEAVKLIKTGKRVKRKVVREIERNYGLNKSEKNVVVFDGKMWQRIYLEDDVLADDWELVE